MSSHLYNKMNEDRFLYKVLLLLFYQLGVISKFSEIAEYQWFQTFSIHETQYLIPITNFAFSPVIIIIAYISDRLSSRISRFTQGALCLVIPTICWFITASSYKVIPIHSVLFCFFLEGFGPSILKMLLDAIMVLYNTSYRTKIAPPCNRMRLMGKTMAGMISGWLLTQTKSIEVIFWIQAVLFLTVLMTVLALKNQVQEPLDYDICMDEENYEDDKEQTKEEQPQPISKTFVLYMTVMMMLPTGGSCFFYYIYGPLEMTANQIGWSDSATALVAILCTYTLPYVERIPVKLFGLLVAVLFSGVNLLRYSLVTRLTFGYVDDFVFIVVTNAIAELADGILWNYYNSGSSNGGSRKGREGTYFAVMMSIPNLGKLIRIAVDTELTRLYSVDHDNYAEYPTILLICVYASFLAFMLSICLR